MLVCKYLTELLLAFFVCKAGGGWVFQLLELAYRILNVAQEHIGHIFGHAVANNYAHNDHILNSLWHCVGRYHPAALLQSCL